MNTTIRIEGSAKRRARITMARFMAGWLVGSLLLAPFGAAALMAGRLHHVDRQIELAERV